MNRFLVVENAFHTFTPTVRSFQEANTRLGDVFFLDDGVAFVPYAEFHIAGALEQGLATLLGGFAGALTASPNEALRAAIKLVKQMREADWGLEVRDRVERNANSILIPSSDIEAIKIAESTFTVQTVSGATYRFAGKSLETLMDDLSDVAAGKDIFRQDEYDRFGLSIPYVAPAKLIDMLLSGNVNQAESNELLSKAADDTKYMLTFGDCFARLKLDQKKRAAVAIAALPGNFGGIFVKRIKRKRMLMSAGCWTIAAIVSLWLFVIPFTVAQYKHSASGMIGVAIFFVLYLLGCYGLLRFLLTRTGHYLPLIGRTRG